MGRDTTWADLRCTSCISLCVKCEHPRAFFASSRERFPRQLIELLANVIGLCRRMGQCDGTSEGIARIVGAIELLEQCAAQTVKVKISGQFFCERINHVQRRLGTAQF
jgi:hypothetical protein